MLFSYGITLIISRWMRKSAFDFVIYEIRILY